VTYEELLELEGRCTVGAGARPGRYTRAMSEAASRPRPRVGLHVIQCLRCHEARLGAHVHAIANERFLIRPRPPQQTTRCY
jgi:hypothetical protein